MHPLGEGVTGIVLALIGLLGLVKPRAIANVSHRVWLEQTRRASWSRPQRERMIELFSSPSQLQLTTWFIRAGGVFLVLVGLGLLVASLLS